MARSVNIGGAKVTLSGDSAELEKALGKVSTAFQKQEAALKRARRQADRTNRTYAMLRRTLSRVAAPLAAALGGRAIIAATQQTIAFSSSLVEASRNIGIMATELEAVRAVLEQDGIGFGATDVALGRMLKTVSDASVGLTRRSAPWTGSGCRSRSFRSCLRRSSSR